MITGIGGTGRRLAGKMITTVTDITVPLRMCIKL